jgi:Tfp pilus assembly protein PilF
MWFQFLLLLVASQFGPSEGILARQAHEAFQARQFLEARHKLEQALRSDPRNATLWFDLGLTYKSLNEIDSAIASFRKVLAISPNTSHAYFALGTLYAQKHESEQALRAYKQGLGLDPADEGANQNYALLLMTAGRYEAALQPLQRLKRTKRLDLSLQIALVECYLRSGLKKQGERELDEILRSPITTDAEKLGIANRLMEDQELDTTAKVLETLVGSTPDSAATFEKFARLLSKRKRYRDAERAVRHAMKLDPGSSEYMRTFAELLLEQKRPQDAVVFLLSVKDQFGTAPDFMYKLALAYYQLTDFRNAANEFNELARNYPQRAEPQFYLGNCYKAMGQFEKAEACYRRAIDLKSDEAQYYTLLADTLRNEKTYKMNQVIALLEKALALDPTDTNARLDLSLCYQNAGNLTKAEALLKDAVRREPTLRRAHLLLARVYGREGKQELAAQESALVGRLDEAEQEGRSKAMGTRKPDR